jgi:mono/diheme cytochrome c family protein
MRKLVDLAALASILAVPLLLAAVLPLLSATGAAPAAAAETAGPPGMQAFVALKCSLCHSVESLGIERKSKSEKTKGPDLSAAGSTHDAAWLRGWLRNEVTNANGKKHDKDFKGTPEQLEQIVGWLATLKKA